MERTEERRDEHESRADQRHEVDRMIHPSPVPFPISGFRSRQSAAKMGRHASRRWLRAQSAMPGADRGHPALVRPALPCGLLRRTRMKPILSRARDLVPAPRFEAGVWEAAHGCDVHHYFYLTRSHAPPAFFPSPCPAHPLPIVWRSGPAGQLEDRMGPRDLTRTRPGATLAWMLGRAHPFPQASCRER